MVYVLQCFPCPSLVFQLPGSHTLCWMTMQSCLCVNVALECIHMMRDLLFAHRWMDVEPCGKNSQLSFSSSVTSPDSLRCLAQLSSYWLCVEKSALKEAEIDINQTLSATLSNNFKRRQRLRFRLVSVTALSIKTAKSESLLHIMWM